MSTLTLVNATVLMRLDYCNSIHIEVCTLNALSNANSPIRSNLFFLRSKYGINFQTHSLTHCIKVITTVEPLDCQSNCLIEQLRIVL